MPTTQPRAVPTSPSSLIALVLPALLAACATGGGPAPVEPGAPASEEAATAAAPAAPEPAAAAAAPAAPEPAAAAAAPAAPEPAAAAAAPAAPEPAAAAAAPAAPEPAAAAAAPAAPEPAAADAAPAAEPDAASSPVAAYLDDPAAITAGRRMFRAVCTGYCHSTTPGVTKDAPNLFDCDWDHGDQDADLYRVIAQGVPDTEMLPFDGKIPEDTIWKVIAYMRSNAADCG